MKKILVAVFVFVISLVGVVPAIAATSTSGSVNEINWILTDDTTLEISGKGKVTSSVVYYINQEINISSIKKIIFADGITEIDDNSFEFSNALESVIIPDSVKRIGKRAFYGCEKLVNIDIGKNVTDMGFQALYPTGYSKKSNLENGALYLDNYLLYADIEYTGVFSVKEGTKLISNFAFAESAGITEIILPDSVEIIGYRGFSNCENLVSLTIGKGLTTVNEAAFSGCNKLQNVYISDISSYCKINFCDSLLKIADNLYLNKEILTSLTVPDGVETIGSHTFSYYDKLTDIKLSDSVTSLGDYAFAYSANLKTIDLGNKLTKIGIGTFAGTAISGIVIPDSVIAIGESAFVTCEKLTDIRIGNSITHMGRWIFSDTGYYNNSVNWDNDVLYVGNYLVDAKETMPIEYFVKTGTRAIAQSAFYYATKLESISIPDSVISIGRWAFSFCENIEKIKVPKTVGYIEPNAFSKKTVLCGYADSEIEKYAFDSQNPYFEIMEETELVSVSALETDNKICISITPKVNITNKSVFSAIYDFSGKLIAATDANAYLISEEPIKIDSVDEAFFVKVFVWDDLKTMKPTSVSAKTVIE